MNSQQVQDIRLMYEAVYNNELREKADEYNSIIRDEDIVEVATEYFYTYGLNSTGVDILIEKVGLDNFVEFVYNLSEDLILTEARKTSKAKKQPSMLASQRAKLAAQKAAKERTETEKKEPESKGADTEAKSEQPKSKKPIRDAIARQILAGMERHRKGMELARETGKTLGKLASVTHEAGRRAGEHVKKHGLKSLANEEYVEEDAQKVVGQALDAAAKNPVIKAIGSVIAPAGKGRKTPTATSGGYRPVKEDVDIFDVILEHLVAEGYADTNVAALAIMANMSEDWKQSIIEQGATDTPSDKARWDKGQKLSDPRAQKIYNKMTGSNPVKLPPA
jgi:hypothetical protein